MSPDTRPDALEVSPRPGIGPERAAELAHEVYGVDGPVRELGSHQDRNFRVDAAHGRHVLKVANRSWGRSAIEAQNAALLHIAARDTTFQAPVPCRVSTARCARCGRRRRRPAAAPADLRRGRAAVRRRHLAPVVVADLGRLAARVERGARRPRPPRSRPRRAVGPAARRRGARRAARPRSPTPPVASTSPTSRPTPASGSTGSRTGCGCRRSTATSPTTTSWDVATTRGASGPTASSTSATSRAPGWSPTSPSRARRSCAMTPTIRSASCPRCAPSTTSCPLDDADVDGAVAARGAARCGSGRERRAPVGARPRQRLGDGTARGRSGASSTPRTPCRATSPRPPSVTRSARRARATACPRSTRSRRRAAVPVGRRHRRRRPLRHERRRCTRALPRADDRARGPARGRVDGAAATRDAARPGSPARAPRLGRASRQTFALGVDLRPARRHRRASRRGTLVVGRGRRLGVRVDSAPDAYRRRTAPAVAVGDRRSPSGRDARLGRRRRRARGSCVDPSLDAPGVRDARHRRRLARRSAPTRRRCSASTSPRRAPTRSRLLARRDGVLARRAGALLRRRRRASSAAGATTSSTPTAAPTSTWSTTSRRSGTGTRGSSTRSTRQLRLLNTNSRFHYAAMVEFAERLAALASRGASTPCSSSTAAPRRSISRCAWRRRRPVARDVIAVREAYHGWTCASDADHDLALRQPRARRDPPGLGAPVAAPNTLPRRSPRPDAGDGYADDAAPRSTGSPPQGRPPAAFIAEPVFGNAGGVAAARRLPRRGLRRGARGRRSVRSPTRCRSATAGSASTSGRSSSRAWCPTSSRSRRRWATGIRSAP